MLLASSALLSAPPRGPQVIIGPLCRDWPPQHLSSHGPLSDHPFTLHSLPCLPSAAERPHLPLTPLPTSRRRRGPAGGGQAARQPAEGPPVGPDLGQAGLRRSGEGRPGSAANDPSGTGRDGTGQDGTGQDRTGRTAKDGQDRTGQGRTGRDRRGLRDGWQRPRPFGLLVYLAGVCRALCADDETRLQPMVTCSVLMEL